MSNNGGMTLTEFLEARIAEDEAAIERRGDFPHSTHQGDVFGIYNAQCPDCLGLVGRARVLADCAAKRAIIESHRNISSALSKEPDLSNRLMLDGMESGMRMALVALTFPYKGHADWDQEWTL